MPLTAWRPAARRALSFVPRSCPGRRLSPKRVAAYKVITVDDQFVNAKGKPMESVPLVMMAASEIGARQGQELYKEMRAAGHKDT